MQNNNSIRPKFLVFPEIKYAAKHVANLVLEQIKANSYSVLGLPTGGTPVTVYKELINLFNQNKVSFKNVTTFNLDEYIGLSEADYANTYRCFMKNNFFDFVDINPSNIYFPASYTDPENCVADYTVYDNLIASKNYMDLLILGVGENGHIGFNEPFTDINSRTHLTSLTENTIRNNSQYIAPNTKTPVQAVTMGLSTILSAKKIVLIAFGAKKAAALSKLFFAREFDQEFPITSLINNPNVTIICDKDAASAIMSKRIDHNGQKMDNSYQQQTNQNLNNFVNPNVNDPNMNNNTNNNFGQYDQYNNQNLQYNDGNFDQGYNNMHQQDYNYNDQYYDPNGYNQNYGYQYDNAYDQNYDNSYDQNQAYANQQYDGYQDGQYDYDGQYQDQQYYNNTNGGQQQQ
ncbi:glucosamine-6-phosphate deaminase [Malacoplasma iowae]|uniref:Glucosamine-6-phosphate deaminase n=1 Tax=Malacoplasma iowae DK-CPA TaxID=1394179 RepID=A0A084U3B9_MALIO|nr:glucosamine-6-phosphate deaminase [Malacoplasma iowae]KFB07455.1 glucosamine-6-phosphate deaminase [Malacoplasma iowae DK-CPA]WPL36635.1 glucosamine-6-phosphate deaminase [Malacoplasma iowae]WPL37861.1 glucosamine-6-phosphate deaminase [Malacoplasma iowae]WPL40188.1 glucosamine-6-phosphate deaminase [Malacoplasma iowae]WPL41253.1 glucosamine-6-phosphate deaminase [Malacoplasma iowae]